MRLDTLKHRMAAGTAAVLTVPAAAVIATAAAPAATVWTVNGPTSAAPISAQVTLDRSWGCGLA